MLSTVVSLSGVFWLTSVQAGPLQNQMDQIFNSMVNTTSPGVYESQRRGVLTGGSAYVRNKVVNTQIAAFAPPSWKAGCGGIDFFAGSFSFINADQFVQLLRSVASNAVGYAFQIALDATCPSCLTTINALQDKIQELNQFAGNSCQLAQGLVNDVADGMNFKRQNREKNLASLTGMMDDFMSGFTESDGKDASTEIAKDPQAAQELYGNLVWKEMQKNNLTNWFVHSLGDSREVYEMLMSITGSVIVDKPEETKDVTGANAGGSSKMHFIDPVMTLVDLVEGEEVTFWDCESDECMTPTTRSESIQGLQKQIHTMLVGGNGSVGIIRKFSNPNNANQLTEQEKSLMAIMPEEAGVLIRNLSVNSEGAARSLAYKLSYAVAVQETYNLMVDLTTAVSVSIASSNMSEAKEMQKKLADVREKLFEDFEALAMKYPGMDEVLRDYLYVNQIVRKQAVMFKTAENTK